MRFLIRRSIVCITHILYCAILHSYFIGILHSFSTGIPYSSMSSSFTHNPLVSNKQFKAELAAVAAVVTVVAVVVAAAALHSHPGD